MYSVRFDGDIKINQSAYVRFAPIVVNSSSFKARIQLAYPHKSRQVCHVKTLPDDHHFLREDRTLRWQRIAGLVDANPKNLDIALENIQRWLDLGRVHPAPLLDWIQRIHDARQSPQAYAEFVAFLSAPNHDSFPIKSCSPFVGLEPSPESR